MPNLEIINVIAVKYQTEPPYGPLILNGITYDHWLNVDTKDFRKWNGKEWIKVAETTSNDH